MLASLSREIRARGLVGAWLGVHVAKRLTGYKLRTGDLFAPAVAIGMAVGRIGCRNRESQLGHAVSLATAANVPALPDGKGR